MVASPTSVASFTPSFALFLTEPKMTWSATAVTAALRGLIVTLILLPLLLLLLHLLVSAGPQRTHGIRAALLA